MRTGILGLERPMEGSLKGYRTVCCIGGTGWWCFCVLTGSDAEG